INRSSLVCTVLYTSSRASASYACTLTAIRHAPTISVAYRKRTTSLQPRSLWNSLVHGLTTASPGVSNRRSLLGLQGPWNVYVALHVGDTDTANDRATGTCAARLGPPSSVSRCAHPSGARACGGVADGSATIAPSGTPRACAMQNNTTNASKGIAII